MAVPSKVEKTFWATPTAHALAGVTAVTDCRAFVSWFGRRFGVGTRFYARPFQCSAIERPLLSPPTAQAFVAELALTSVRSLPLGPAAALVQLRPFQCRISDLSWVSDPAYMPTAQVLVADTRRTVLTPSMKLPGLGLGTRPYCD